MTPHVRTPRPLACALAATSLSASAAMAQWPTDPADPLVLGQTRMFGSLGYGAAVGADGALWAAWTDGGCPDALLVQRVGPDGGLLLEGGLVAQAEAGCFNAGAPVLAAGTDGAATLALVAGHLDETPLHRFEPDGTAPWGPGVVVEPKTNGTIGGLLGLAGGDVLVAWHSGTTLTFDRYAPEGSPVWPAPATIPSVATPRVFGLVPDGEDGAIVLWDTSAPYVRVPWAARVTGAGQIAWGPVRCMPELPGASRHTPPAAITDGAGGAVMVWAQGHESGAAPVPLLVKRISADGTLVFDPDPVRVSLGTERQFDPVLTRDTATGDIFIAWRDGFMGQEVRVQRLTIAGDRLWGDHGRRVAPLTHPAISDFDIHWDGRALSVIVADEPVDAAAPTLNLHNLSGHGQRRALPRPLSGPLTATQVHLLPLVDGLAAVWLREAPLGSLWNELVALKIEPMDSTTPKRPAGQPAVRRPGSN